MVQKSMELAEAGRVLAISGASKGGRARKESLSPERRTEIARRAVQARWAKAGKAEISRRSAAFPLLGGRAF